MPRMTKVEKPSDFKKNLWRLIKYIKPYYFKIILAMFMIVCSTLLCIYGPRLTGRATTIVSEGIISKYQGGPGIDFEAIFKIVTILIILYSVSALIDYIVNIIMVKISVGISYKLKEAINHKINKLPLKYFDSKTHGEVLSRMTNDVDTITGNLANAISSILSGVVNIVGILIIMFSISVKITLISLITIPLTAMAAAFIVSKSQKYFVLNQELLGNINGHIEEMYAGHLIVKTYNYEKESIAKFENINDKLFKAGYKSQFMSAIIHPVSIFLGNVTYVIVCLMGGLQVVKGVIAIGDVQSLITYTKRINQPITSLAQVINTIQSMVAAAERVFDMLDEQEEVKDTSNPIKIVDDNSSETNIQGNVTFENVCFGYDPNNIIIHNFSMYVASGKEVAIVGPTGAGKTTLVKLLMRFYELNDGAIYVDFNNIKDYLRSDLRSMFGMVLQDAFLFEASVKENLKYGKPDASDEEIIKACKMAHVHHFIMTLENGYDTIISEDSSAISQGQKQLLTIARAFLSDPKILILDEATSSVDTRTEHLIQDSMNTLRKGRTSFTIAHRLSTIKNADIILVLDKGDVVEVGNHVELMEKQGYYYRLYNSQFDA